MRTSTQMSEAVIVVRGEQEVFRRTAHLFASASEITCAANDLATWGRENGLQTPHLPRRRDGRLRKVYRSGTLLNPVWARHIAAARDQHGAQIRVTAEEMNETIILDGRLAILAGDLSGGQRGYSLITQPETVQGVASLFEAAWRSATDLDVYDAQVAEIRRLAPQVLDLLSQGVKDETAARALGLGVRTYRRRVAELMTALGAESRFQAGVRARELGLV